MGKLVGSIVYPSSHMEVQANKKEGSAISMKGTKEPTIVNIPTNVGNTRKGEINMGSVVYS
jgi:hypothetical protein